MPYHHFNFNTSLKKQSKRPDLQWGREGAKHQEQNMIWSLSLFSSSPTPLCSKKDFCVKDLMKSGSLKILWKAPQKNSKPKSLIFLYLFFFDKFARNTCFKRNFLRASCRKHNWQWTLTKFGLHFIHLQVKQAKTNWLRYHLSKSLNNYV